MRLSRKRLPSRHSSKGRLVPRTIPNARSIGQCAFGCEQAALKVWRYGNQQYHLPHVDNDLESVVTTIIVFLSDSGENFCLDASLLHMDMLSHSVHSHRSCCNDSAAEGKTFQRAHA